MSQDLGLRQIVNFPTRGSSILDLMFTSHPSFVKNCYPTSRLGDHDAVKTEISLNPIKKKPIKRRIQLWNKADETEILKAASDLRSKFLNTFTIQDNVNQIWERLFGLVIVWTDGY